MIAVTIKYYGPGDTEPEMETFTGVDYYQASVKMHEYISAYRVNRYQIVEIMEIKNEG